MMPSDATPITTDDLLRIIGDQHVQIVTLQRMLAQREVLSATEERALRNHSAGPEEREAGDKQADRQGA